MSNMFSPDDMRELAQAFSGSRIAAFPAAEQGDVHLIPAVSGEGFVRPDAVPQAANEVIEAEGEGRLALSKLAASLDIPKEELSAILRDPGVDLLLSADGQSAICKTEADRLQGNLLELVEGRVVYAAGVAIANDLALDSIPKLIAMNLHGAQGDEEEDIPRLALYPETRDVRELRKAVIFSPYYLEDLMQLAHETFSKAQESGEVESVPQDTVLPTAFLQLMVEKLGSAFDGRFSTDEGAVQFTPTSFLESQRDEKLEGLQDGTTSSFDLQWLVDLMPEQYPDLGAAARYIQDAYPDDVFMFVDTVVSKAWHERITQSLQDDLMSKSIVNVSDGFQSLSADAAREATAKAHAQILAYTRQRRGWETISEGFYPFLIRVDLFNTIQDTFTEHIRQHAKYLWSQSDKLPESELTLDVPSLLREPAAQLHLPAGLLPILLKCSCDGGAKATFNATLSQLEADADAAFAAFWRDRVTTRVELHSAALLSPSSLASTNTPSEPSTPTTTESTQTLPLLLQDKKLRAQLLDLLRDYVAKDLVPDAVARAESRNLVRSARSKRNIKKLQSALADHLKSASSSSSAPSSSSSPEQGVQAVRQSLHRFAAKLDIAPLEDADALRAGKEAYVREMVRGMQRDGDAPRLFLTAVVVLLARREAGVVYATGKFAPKLLKLLKSAAGAADGGDGGVGEGKVPGEETFRRLEELKDMVKAGAVGEAEREEMRKMATEAWEV